MQHIDDRPTLHALNRPVVDITSQDSPGTIYSGIMHFIVPGQRDVSGQTASLLGRISGSDRNDSRSFGPFAGHQCGVGEKMPYNPVKLVAFVVRADCIGNRICASIRSISIFAFASG